MSERDLNIDELKAENQQLRTVLATVLVSVSAALLRQVAVETATRRPPERADAQRLVRDADECFRCAKIPGLKAAIAEGLEVAGHELMAKAVEIEAALQRDRR